MPICPECNHGFDEGLTHCPKCGAWIHYGGRHGSRGVDRGRAAILLFCAILSFVGVMGQIVLCVVLLTRAEVLAGLATGLLGAPYAAGQYLVFRMAHLWYSRDQP